MMYRRLRLPPIAWTFLLIGLAAPWAGAEQDPEAVAEETLKDALRTFANRRGLQLVYPTELAEGKTAKGIVAARNAKNQEQELDLLLAGSGLGYRFVNARTVAIEETGDLTGGSDPDAAESGADDAEDEAAEADDEANDDVEVVLVTGSRIPRKAGEMDRQVTVFDRVEIEASGATTFEEFMRELPQSVNAPSSNGAAFAGDFGSTANTFAAAGVNLRGLGERATLVLIDGRRTARGGVLGEATDINQIPISMIERVEVIFDGASAIYGARCRRRGCQHHHPQGLRGCGRAPLPLPPAGGRHGHDGRDPRGHPRLG